MLDRETMAKVIGLIQNNNALTEQEISNRLGIDIQEIEQIIDALIDLKLVDDFDNFVARVDLALLN